jgi:hypothetical protein
MLSCMNLVLEYQNAIHFSALLTMCTCVAAEHVYDYAWIVLGSSIYAWTEAKNVVLQRAAHQSIYVCWAQID